MFPEKKNDSNYIDIYIDIKSVDWKSVHWKKSFHDTISTKLTTENVEI